MSGAVLLDDGQLEYHSSRLTASQGCILSNGRIAALCIPRDYV